MTYFEGVFLVVPLTDAGVEKVDKRKILCVWNRNNYFNKAFLNIHRSECM